MKYPCLLTKKISEISPAKYNPRKISDEAMGRLTKSLAEFGNIQPITWNARTGNVVGGHQRLKVYQAMGKTEVEVWAVDLDEQKEKAANIALNKLAGEFDLPALKDILQDIDTGEIDLEITGFGMDEIALMMEDAHPEVTEDEVPEVPVDAITKPGDLWILGEHRVLCGDATIEANVSGLMNGEKADMVFTDPPYGIKVVSNTSVGGGGALKFGGKKGKIVNSTKGFSEIIGDDTTDTARKFYNTCMALGFENFIIFGGNYFTDFLPPSMGWIVWYKKNTGNFADFEMAWTSYNKASRLYEYLWNGLSRQGSRELELVKRVHPTQKPVGLNIEILKNYEYSLIFDGFLGSGSTLIAAEQLGRKCYGMEISPNYCDVIVKRWENLSGKKATLAK
jgi:DNA modification methylase